MEITVNAIVKELENRGYIVDEQTCIKNGIEVLGLAVKKNEDDKVVPTIYPEDIIREADERGLAVSEVVECLIPVIEQRPSIDIDRFTDREYLLSHVRIGVHEFVLLPSSIHECILVPHTFPKAAPSGLMIRALFAVAPGYLSSHQEVDH